MHGHSLILVSLCGTLDTKKGELFLTSLSLWSGDCEGATHSGGGEERGGGGDGEEGRGGGGEGGAVRTGRLHSYNSTSASRL